MRSRSRSRSPPRRRRRRDSEVDDFGRIIRRAEPRDKPRAVAPTEGCRLFVGNLSYDSTVQDVEALFARWGKVVDCHLPADRETGQPRGFGFVTMQSPAEASAAAAAAEVELGGRQLRVDLAGPRGGRKPFEQATRPVWGRPDLEAEPEKDVPDPDAAKPDFGLSGALAKDETTGNVYKGHVLKFTEPDDAAKPRERWRVYVFKDDDVAETLHIHRQSAFLVGRLKDIADILTMHPSCSGQHAVIQFRLRPGDLVLPYVMDLDSTNGTFLNDAKIEAARYVELRHKDVLRFGSSTRDYVLLNSSLGPEGD